MKEIKELLKSTNVDDVILGLAIMTKNQRKNFFKQNPISGNFQLKINQAIAVFTKTGKYSIGSLSDHNYIWNDSRFRTDKCALDTLDGFDLEIKDFR